jgi:hypothetical protein
MSEMDAGPWTRAVRTTRKELEISWSWYFFLKVERFYGGREKTSSILSNVLLDMSLIAPLNTFQLLVS